MKEKLEKRGGKNYEKPVSIKSQQIKDADNFYALK